MKRITICVLLILFLLTTKQYAQWEWYNPIPNTNGMRSTQILSDSVFIILDTHGNVFKTEDNGSSFNNITVYSDAFYPLIMKFTSINKGWFIGLLDYDKTILVSTNDGCKSYNLELEGNLTSIFFLNEYIGWIADSDTIYFTNNGGKNWEQLGNIESNFVKMYFLDNETGYAIAWGSWGYNAIYKTTDGGYNWTKIHNGEPVENYESIYFINDSLGYVCGSKSLGTTRGIIVNTSDGGNDWNLQEIYDYHNIYSIKFISESVGFFNGYGFGDGKWNVGISKTIDAGEVWNKVVTIPDDKNEFLVGELDIFENKKIVTVFGNNSIILSSEDSGNSWNALTKNIFKELIGNENQNFKSICFPTENVGFLSTEKAIFKTVDAGLNWSLIKESNLNHISACDELNIWAVGDNANIIRSKDGGDTWEKIIIDIYDFNSFNWDKVEVINENEIIIFGSIWIEDMYSGGYYISSILKTIDSGENWVFATVNGTYSRIDDVFFLSKMKGWAIGNHIIHTSDGGHTWKKIDNFSDYIGLNCIYFHSDLLGFSAGFGKVFKTIDGGYNWEKIDGFETWQFFYDINFIDNQNGILAGREGLILSTNDGGKTWVDNSVKTFASFTNLTFNGNTGWLIGSDYSILLKTFNGTSIDYKTQKNPSGSFILYQNYPNPFNATTTIRYQLPIESHVTINVYNTLGQQVITIVNKNQDAGYHTVHWNTDLNASGIYFYRIHAEGITEQNKKTYSKVMKMLLLR